MADKWIWDEPSNWHGLSARVCTEKYEPIAEVRLSGWPRKIGIAHAKLIAAAPALLATLQEIIDNCGCSEDNDSCANCKRAEAAIAAAK